MTLAAEEHSGHHIGTAESIIGQQGKGKVGGTGRKGKLGEKGNGKQGAKGKKGKH